VRRRGGRKRAMGTRRPMETPVAANQRWSLDFVSDQMTDGRRFRILAVVDDCTRECLALVADTSLSGLRVARELDSLVRHRGRPGNHRQRQRHGADLQRHLEMVGRDRRRLALHRAGKAPAERLRRKLQRSAPRRTAQRDPVPLAAARPRRARGLAARLQRGAAALEPRLTIAVSPSPFRSKVPSPGRRILSGREVRSSAPRATAPTKDLVALGLKR
jgi:hypothetical protein